MYRSLLAFAAVLALSVPTFAQGPSTTIVNQGNFNVNKVVNVSGPSFGGYYPGRYYPAPGPSNQIFNFGSGNVNVIRNVSPSWGGYRGAPQNTIVNIGNGNQNRIINR